MEDFSDVFLTIEDNVEYVNEFCPEKIGYTQKSFRDIETDYPFEYKILTYNFRTIWSCMGINIDLDKNAIPIGEIDPDYLIERLDNMIEGLCLKEDEVQYCECGNNIVKEGISEGYIDEIKTILRKLATEAKDRGKMIIWE